MSNSKKHEPTFAIIGLGFISDRHLAAIKAVGGNLVAGCDIDESKKHKVEGVKFFKDYRKMLKEKFDYVAICTPNYLHNKMILESVYAGHSVIVEKPTVLKYKQLRELVAYNLLINSIFQLRYNPELIELQKTIDSYGDYTAKFEVCIHRDDWYWKSWKNDKHKSGGLLFNIGVHYFDLLCWLFGTPLNYELLELTDKKANGTLTFENCYARWNLSIDQPIDNQYRYLKIDNKKINLTENFEDLHTKVYREILAGNGILITDVEPVIRLLDNYAKY